MVLKTFDKNTHPQPGCVFFYLMFSKKIDPGYSKAPGLFILCGYMTAHVLSPFYGLNRCVR